MWCQSRNATLPHKVQNLTVTIPNIHAHKNRGPRVAIESYRQAFRSKAKAAWAMSGIRE